MAVCTLDLMVGDMVFMHELRSIFGTYYIGFIVALDTLPLRNMAISSDDIDMTLLAGHTSGDIFAMVEAPTFDFNIAFWLNMAGCATPNGTGDTLFLSFRPSPIVMANEAVDFVNSEMGSLDELGMAGGASELHSPSQLTQMFSMGEGHILIDHISLKIFNLMTSLLETSCIADLSMGFARSLPRDEIGQ